MHKMEIIDPSEHKDWNDLILNTTGHSFFHTAAWADVLRRAYGYTPLYFTTCDQKHFTALLAVMEVKSILTGKRGVSLPFTDHCEPIFSSAAQCREMLTSLIAFGKKRNWDYLELRGGDAFFQNEEPSESYYGHTLDLTPGSQRIFSSLRDSTRRNINKAKREDIEVTISTSAESMNEFCRLNAITRRDHGLPPQPYRFFQCVHDHILSQNSGFIVLAFFSKTAIAGNVYFSFGDAVIYKYGASDRAYQHLRANNLVMWEAIQWSCQKGYKTLDFGRTEPENEGLRQFKSGWSPREHLIKYYRYDLQKDAFIKTPGGIKPLYKKIFSKLPIPALNMLGNILYRHMG
jgi:hypothetical protein